MNGIGQQAKAYVSPLPNVIYETILRIFIDLYMYVSTL